jgi:hypothetical protein
VKHFDIADSFVSLDRQLKTRLALFLAVQSPTQEHYTNHMKQERRWEK